MGPSRHGCSIPQQLPLVLGCRTGRCPRVSSLPAGEGAPGACPAPGLGCGAAQSPTKMLPLMGCGSASISGCPAQMNALGSAGDGAG